MSKKDNHKKHIDLHKNTFSNAYGMTFQEYIKLTGGWNFNWIEDDKIYIYKYRQTFICLRDGKRKLIGWEE